MVVGPPQISQFFRQKPGFYEIIEVCLNLGSEFCITWLLVPNCKKISPYKLNCGHEKIIIFKGVHHN